MSAMIVTSEKHSGTYSVMTEYVDWLVNMLVTPITKACIQSATLWLKDVHLWGSQPYAVNIIIYYTDATETSFDVNLVDGVWTEVDLLAQMESGKTIAGVRIFNYKDIYDTVYVDDLSIVGKG